MVTKLISYRVRPQTQGSLSAGGGGQSLGGTLPILGGLAFLRWGRRPKGHPPPATGSWPKTPVPGEAGAQQPGTQPQGGLRTSPRLLGLRHSLL